MSKLYYSWKDFDNDVTAIVKMIKENKLDIKNVYGVPRGGLVMGVAISHRLDKPMILDKAKITKGTLIVDDILDTGKTLNKLWKNGFLPPCVLCWNDAKLQKNKIPHVIVGTETKGKWVVFPWETKKTSKYDNTI